MSFDPKRLKTKVSRVPFRLAWYRAGKLKARLKMKTLARYIQPSGRDN